MKGIIIYKSNYGTTKRYAEWLAEETGFACVEVGAAKARDFGEYDAVVFGSPVFADKPQIAGWIRKNWKRLEGKKVALFTTSGTSPENVSLQGGFEASFSPEIREKMKYVPLGGRMVFAELKPLHRRLMKMGMKMEKDPKVREEMGRDKDGVDRSGLAPLVDYLL